MRSAFDICRLLIEEEQPEFPEIQAHLTSDDNLDPRQELDRLAADPLPLPGNGPPDTYQRLLLRFTNPRRDRVKIGNNTYVVRHHDRLAVRLHKTDVIIAYPDKRVFVDSGGWRPDGKYSVFGWTAPVGRTTLDRISDWLPSGWHIMCRNKSWFWYNRDTERGTAADQYWLPYSDMDWINANGNLNLQASPVPHKPKRRRV